MMTLTQLYDELRHSLEPSYGEGEAKAIARWVLEDQCGASMTDILLGREAHNWNPEILTRLKAGEPVQHVLGYATFCGLQVNVNTHVLIPRPETEALVDAKEGWTHGHRILDMCTGSGCIALAHKHFFPNAEVEAWDLSAEALHVARENFQHHSCAVTTRQVDLLTPESWPQVDGFDLIVSNPPYVCDRERSEMEPHVLNYEPRLALFVPDNDPLLHYRALASLGHHYLRRGGWIKMECNTQFVPDVVQLFRQAEYTEIVTHDDCYGKPRFVEAKYA